MNNEPRTMNNEQRTMNKLPNLPLYALRYPLYAARYTLFSSTQYAILNTRDEIALYNLSRELYKSPLFMQNKPKVRKSQMNVKYYITKDYENETLGERGKNKAKQSQSQNRQNELNFIYNNELRTKNYER